MRVIHRPLVVLSDIHLSHEASLSVSKDLAELVRVHRGHELVLAGDVLDLSLERPGADPTQAVVALLDRHRDVVSALRDHLKEGGPVTLIAGNHDAATSRPAVRDAMISKLELDTDAPLQTSPWFVRRGSVHVEHGHLYDPDNAPVHPLAPWSVDNEPIGVALTRNFLAPSGAYAFAHAHESTPLPALRRAFGTYGVRAPVMIAQYFAAAAGVCVRAGRRRHRSDQEHGEREIEQYSRAIGLEATALRDLLDARPAPTHLSAADTFFRLYFDRVIATFALAVGSTTAVAGSMPGAVIAALGGAYLAVSVAREPNRYGGGQTEERLREAAAHVAHTTGADLVVFGHSHREDEAPRYLNSGSFGFPRRTGRPFIVIGTDGHAERHAWTIEAEPA